MEAHPISFCFVIDGLNIEPPLHTKVARVDGVLRPSFESHADFAVGVIADIGHSAQIADSPNPCSLNVHGGCACNITIAVCRNHHLVALSGRGKRRLFVMQEGTIQKNEC